MITNVDVLCIRCDLLWFFRVYKILWSNQVSVEKQNLQDIFLNACRKSKDPVTLFLVNGVKLQGVITWFDNFSVLLRRDTHSQLVYKHAISTVMPLNPVKLFDEEESEE